MTVARALEAVLGPDLPIAVHAYDGSRFGPADAPATLVIRSPNVFRRLVSAPGELGLGRAYVSGELDVEGDLYAALAALRDRIPDVRAFGAREWADILRFAGSSVLRTRLSPLPIPREEVRLGGVRHSKARDAAAIAHHYDVSNAFYRIVLGPSMTYSCAVWAGPDVTLEDAQAAKVELVCRKLGLEPGMRLLDVGCGWGGMVLHAAERHGVRAVGVTLSRRQAEWAEKAVAEAGLVDRVEIRHQDYRDVRDGPFDAISSIGMFEHVGLSQLRTYFGGLRRLLRPGGRLLNHGISRPPNAGRTRFRRNSFIDRYVFPDGELHEVGSVVSTIQGSGLEVRHLESLREHYALTLRAWVRNLEASWDAAVAEVGPGRARVWRLYMAASALNFETGRTQVHQVLAVRLDRGGSGLPLRPRFE
ncbi:MAG TPA: cyclopropane-fatty-acyl-phospholipid synthase family protein [Actinomycetota bacterium]|nr:cyclopropane-fatty-acyl-phospholipid synthase family protein [Actinomycetota bacterium]